MSNLTGSASGNPRDSTDEVLFDAFIGNEVNAPSSRLRGSSASDSPIGRSSRRTSFGGRVARAFDFLVRVLIFLALVSSLFVGVVQPADWTTWLYGDRAPLENVVEVSQQKVSGLQSEVDQETAIKNQLSSHRQRADELSEAIDKKNHDIWVNNNRNTSAAELNAHDDVLQKEKGSLLSKFERENQASAALNAQLTGTSTHESALESEKRQLDAANSQLAKHDGNVEGASHYARLFCLGGFGALATLLIAYCKGRTSLVKAPYLGRNIASIFVGGLVAVSLTGLVMAGVIPLKISVMDLLPSARNSLLIGLSLCSGAVSESLIRGLTHWVESYYRKGEARKDPDEAPNQSSIWSARGRL
ncbi:hypothetical protein SAMN05414139_02932 [Burkholderia sp. D7]|nr:hypothetical protein SAMN05414139_02932 [Burkholderia sp. D7]